MLQKLRFTSLALITFTMLAPRWAAAAPAHSDNTLPITTHSRQARQLFDSGLVKMENLHSIEGIQDLHKAAQLDPDFALANILISFESVDQAVDPEEKVAARERELQRGKHHSCHSGHELCAGRISKRQDGGMAWRNLD
jgi:hypothetical protein